MSDDRSVPVRRPSASLRPTRPAASRRAIARMFEADLSAPIVNAGLRTSNPRELSERVAMGRALWRELVIGFASQLGRLRLGFTQLAALYVLADGGVTTVSDLADTLGRSPSATSRLVDGLVRRRLVERRPEVEDRRQKTLWLTQRGKALLRMVDPARPGGAMAGAIEPDHRFVCAVPHSLAPDDLQALAGSECNGLGVGVDVGERHPCPRIPSRASRVADPHVHPEPVVVRERRGTL